MKEDRVRQLARDFGIAYFELSHESPDGFSAMREHIMAKAFDYKSGASKAEERAFTLFDSGAKSASRSTTPGSTTVNDRELEVNTVYLW